MSLPPAERTVTRTSVMKDEYEVKEGYNQADIEKIRDDQSEHVDPAFERSTMRKVDMRVLPILGVLYSVALIGICRYILIALNVLMSSLSQTA